MDIFDYAIKTEIEGIAFYKELAIKAPDDSLKKIFNWLALEEELHRQVFEEMKNKQKTSYKSSDILSSAKTLFEEMTAGNVHFSPNKSQIELYKKAQTLELAALKFYQEKANESKDPTQKEILLEIATEEDKHYFLLENIINFVSRPKDWVENSEFNHLDDYYE